MELRESEYEDSRVLQLVKFAEELSAAGLINEAAAYLIEARETVVEMDTATSWCGAICVALITEVARAQADLGLTEDARETAMRGDRHNKLLRGKRAGPTNPG